MYNGWMDISEAAKMLGLSKSRVRQFCNQGRLGRKVGSRWIISESEVTLFKSEPRLPGRPSGATGDENSCVYLLKCGPYYKIGASSRIDDRIKHLSVLPPFDVELIHTIPTGDMYALETELHRRFADKRKNGEWFELNQDDVEYIKEIPSNVPSEQQQEEEEEEGE